MNTKIGIHVGIWLCNNHKNLIRLHRFTVSVNIAKRYTGGGLLFYSHCRELIRSIDAFEQWCYRRMLKIGYKDRV